MANVVTVPPSPQPWDVIQGFVDKYTQNRQQQQAMELQRKQLEQSGQYQDRMATVSEGGLKNQQDQFALLKTKYNDEQLTAEAKPIVERLGAYHDAIQAEQDPTKKAALMSQAQNEAAQLKATRPDLLPYIQIAAMEPVMSPQRQADLNSAQFDAKQTGAALNTTDPVAANYATQPEGRHAARHHRAADGG
jgi:hypothetical protein